MHFNIGLFSLEEIYRILRPCGIFIFNTYKSELISYQSILRSVGFEVGVVEYDELPGSHKILSFYKPNTR